MKEENHLQYASKLRSPITRRDFVRGTAFAMVGLSAGVNVLGCEGKPSEHLPLVKKPYTREKSKVVLARNHSIMDEKHKPKQSVVEDMLNEAILILTDGEGPVLAWRRFIKPSDTVGIKMNVQMTATHLEVVKAIVKSLHAIGVADQKIIIWDRDKVGIGYEGVENRNRSFGFRNNISKIITDYCTALINVPGTKVHWLAGIGVALKNWLGAVNKINTKDRFVSFRLHSDSCAEACSINAIPVIRDKCRLIVVDALRPLFHGGPQVDPKYLWDYKGLLISTDPVATDTVCLKILQDKRNEFKGRDWPINPPAKHIFVADNKYGLGNSNWDKIELNERIL
jgi:uncharacterized protein (DUF362 family)